MDYKEKIEFKKEIMEDIYGCFSLNWLDPIAGDTLDMGKMSQLLDKYKIELSTANQVMVDDDKNEEKIQQAKDNIDYGERLVNILNFMNIICIDGGCGYDLKEIVSYLAYGEYDYDRALYEWKKRGWYRLG